VKVADPLEEFLTEYVDSAGGITEEVEPQVYDVLLPDAGILPDAGRTLRVAFDPEALPEHPHAQLVTFGSALLDELLGQAQAHGRLALAYLDDVHLTPHGLEQRVRRDFILPTGASLEIQTARPLYVTTTVLWFETTFVSDEKEQSIAPIAVDRYYGRLVHHLEPLVEGDRLSEIRRYPYPDAPLRPLDEAYRLASERLARSVSAEANSRKQEISARQAKQRERMTRYFADMRGELNERLEKAEARAEEMDSLRARVEALDREERVRLEELQRKTMVRVQIKLTNVLHVKTPRLFLNAHLAYEDGKHAPTPLTLTWDAIAVRTDAPDCPSCQRPTYELRLGRRGELRCPYCEKAGALASP
jgi:hypothetical protein